MSKRNYREEYNNVIDQLTRYGDTPDIKIIDFMIDLDEYNDDLCNGRHILTLSNDLNKIQHTINTQRKELMDCYKKEYHNSLQLRGSYIQKDKHGCNYFGYLIPELFDKLCSNATTEMINNYCKLLVDKV